MMKRRLWLGAGLIALSSLLLAACGGKSSSDNSSSSTLTLWSNHLTPATTISDWKKSPFHKGLEKATGIKVNWEFPTEGADPNQAFSLMTSEKQLPDLIQYEVAQDAETYIKDGVIKDLTKLLPKKAPHYWAFLKKHPDYARALKTDSGKYYAFGFFRAQTNAAMTMGPMIRKDWLDAQHLSAPQTPDEWENVLKVFKDKYGAKLAFAAYKMDPGFAGAFGAYGTFNPTVFIDKNNKLQLSQAQPQWKTYMTWLNKLYKEGLIDPDVVTMSDSDLQTKVLNDKVSATITTMGTMTTYEENAKAKGSKAEWIGVKYPNQEDGQKSAAIQYDQMVSVTAFSVGGTTTGKKLDEALKWLDFAFTEKGQKYWNFGTEGKSYDEVNGQPEFSKTITDNKMGTYEALKTYTGNVESGLGIQNFKVVKARMSPSGIAASSTWYNENKAGYEIWPSNRISYTPAESKQFASLSNNLSTYISENSMKFLTGEKPLSEYDTFVSGMKSKGLKDYMKIRQAGYDRYLKR